MILEIELINTAAKDLSAAEKLYETEHFSNAVFMLQQCVEKCIKSYGIAIKIIDEPDLSKKINHHAHRIFSREIKAKIEKLKRYKNTPLLIPDMVPPHQRGKSNDDKNIEFLERLFEKINFVRIEELENLSEDELKKFIISARTFKIQTVENEEEYLQHFKDDWIKTNQHFLNYFTEVFSGKELDDMLESVNYSLENADFFAANRLAKFKYET